MGNKLLSLIVWVSRNLSHRNMVSNEELEKRIETLEKEVQQLKAILQYQMRNKKKWFILNEIAITFSAINIFLLRFRNSNFKAKDIEFDNSSIFLEIKF